MMVMIIYAHKLSIDHDPSIHFEMKHGPLTHSFSMTQVF
jgi:hypothetical protein